jgi:MarR family transcriptional regulator for hemolysin
MSQAAAGEGPGHAAADTLGYQINLAARAMRGLLDARFAEQEATFADWVVLNVLATRGAQIQRDLAGTVDVEGPTMVRRLDQLEAAGLVERGPVARDRRATRVSLTEDGRRMYERLRDTVQRTGGDLLSGLDPQELATTQQVLRRLTERARALRQR